MPYLNLKLSTTPSPQQTARIAQSLTTLTAEILRKKAEATAVAIETVAPSAWFISGASLVSRKSNSFFLDIKITDGTNTKEEKAAYIRSVFAEMENLLGGVEETSYIVIHDVRGDSWGFNGKTQEFRALNPA